MFMAWYSYRPNVLSLLTILTAALSGCGANMGDGFSGERGQVSGKVTVNGEPLAPGCQIIFSSATGGYTASGVIKEDGVYSLNYSDSVGLPAVDYMIQFTEPVMPDVPQSVDPSQMAAKMKLGPKAKTASDSTSLVPLKYLSTNTSGLTYKVENGQNTKDFALEAK
jgi:hypothetical protein